MLLFAFSASLLCEEDDTTLSGELFVSFCTDSAFAGSTAVPGCDEVWSPDFSELEEVFVVDESGTESPLARRGVVVGVEESSKLEEIVKASAPSERGELELSERISVEECLGDRSFSGRFNLEELEALEDVVDEALFAFVSCCFQKEKAEAMPLLEVLLDARM